jgi:hypothetical protein
VSIELIAVLVTAAFQFAGLIYIARIARSLDQTVRAYSVANLESATRLEEAVRQVNDYVRMHGAEIDKFIAEFGQQARSTA